MSRQDFGSAAQPSRAYPRHDAVTVTPSAAEVPLRITLLVVGTLLWIVIVVSVVGLVYGLMIGLLLFVAHVGLIAHLRGSSIKLGPNQMPEIYARVVELSRRMGLKKVPDVYLRQSGGLLNAFATRFGRANFVVLFSELVYACGNNVNALDFIIAHELGHLHRGHLNWRWLLAPAFVVPFLGTAYSRACEYTCDRYGFQIPSEPDHDFDGLCILAAGPQFASLVNRKAFASQDHDLNSTFMKLGEWFSTHPPLTLRLAALAPALQPAPVSSVSATLGAFLIAVLIVLVPVAGGAFFVMSFIHGVQQQIENSQKKVSAPPYPAAPSFNPPSNPLPGQRTR